MSKLLITVVRLAMRSLRRNPLRSALTSLGIVVGVAAVIAMVSLGQGARATLEAQIRSVGTNIVMVLPGATTTSGARSGWGGGVGLTVEDADAIRKYIAQIRHVAYHDRSVAQVQSPGENWSTVIWGVSASYADLREWPLHAGEFFNERQEEVAARVAVLGQTVADMLFGEGSLPVGQQIRIKDVPFQVIGVLEPKGQNAYGSDQDDAVFIPFPTAQRKVLGKAKLGSVDMIQLALVSEEAESEVIEEVTQLLRQRHRIQPGAEDDFGIRTMAEMARAADDMARVMSNLLLAIASISLLVGGIGIMNILLVSVAERTREIGIRMAVGAKSRHILAQFLCEAIALSSAGGLAGVALGVFASDTLSRLSGWPTLIAPTTVVGSFAFSAVVGVFFGYYPARKAAQMNPIEALRYD